MFVFRSHSVRLPCIPVDYFKSRSYAELVEGMRDSKTGYNTGLKLTMKVVNEGLANKLRLSSTIFYRLFFFVRYSNQSAW